MKGQNLRLWLPNGNSVIIIVTARVAKTLGLAKYEAGLKAFSEILIENKDPGKTIERLAKEASKRIQAAKRRGIPVELLMPTFSGKLKPLKKRRRRK